MNNRRLKCSVAIFSLSFSLNYKNEKVKIFIIHISDTWIIIKMLISQNQRERIIKISHITPTKIKNIRFCSFLNQRTTQNLTFIIYFWQQYIFYIHCLEYPIQIATYSPQLYPLPVLIRHFSLYILHSFSPHFLR